MNAGRDVERLIAGWLSEEAPGRAPDRILDAAGRVIDRTNQRRFVVAWRLPTMNPLARLAAVAVVAVVAVGGALFILNESGPSIGNASPPPPSIEGTWETTFTRAEMLAAGIVDSGEDTPENYGHFVISIHGGIVVQVQLTGPMASGYAPYVADGKTYTVTAPDGVFSWSYTVTETTLTFSGTGPVTMRVKPWTRIGP